MPIVKIATDREIITINDDCLPEVVRGILEGRSSPRRELNRFALTIYCRETSTFTKYRKCGHEEANEVLENSRPDK